MKHLGMIMYAVVAVLGVIAAARAGASFLGNIIDVMVILALTAVFVGYRYCVSRVGDQTNRESAAGRWLRRIPGCERNDSN
jgi:energy-coupling factor transporter transmembrane protein EcfT